MMQVYKRIRGFENQEEDPAKEDEKLIAPIPRLEFCMKDESHPSDLNFILHHSPPPSSSPNDSRPPSPSQRTAIWKEKENLHVLTKDTKSAPVRVGQAEIVRVTSNSVWIRYAEEGVWFEEIKEAEFWRIRPLTDTTPQVWSEHHFETTFYNDILTRTQLSRPLQPQSAVEEDDWERPKKKIPLNGKQKKKKPPSPAEKEPKTPAKQTTIPQFFSPTANVTFSPTPIRTLNGEPLHVRRQSRLVEFFQPANDPPPASTSPSNSTDDPSTFSRLSSSATSRSVSAPPSISTLRTPPSSASTSSSSDLAIRTRTAPQIKSCSTAPLTTPLSTVYSSPSIAEYASQSTFSGPKALSTVSFSPSTSEHASQSTLSGPKAPKSKNLSAQSPQQTGLGSSSPDSDSLSHSSSFPPSSPLIHSSSAFLSDQLFPPLLGGSSKSSKHPPPPEVIPFSPNQTNPSNASASPQIKASSSLPKQRHTRKRKTDDDTDESEEESENEKEESENERNDNKKADHSSKKEKKTENSKKEKKTENSKNEENQQSQKNRKSNKREETYNMERSFSPSTECSHVRAPQIPDPYPAYEKANFAPNALWKQSEKSLADIKTQANDAFERMKYWKKNIWKTPSGKVGKSLALEISHLIESWTKGTTLELTALTLCMIFLPLMLQKSGPKVKAKAVKEIVAQRLEKWNKGEILELFKEAEYLQAHSQNGAFQNQNSAQIFARLMLQGKVKAALRIVAGTQGGVAKASEEVLRKLKEKHPEAAPTDDLSILPGDFQKVPDSVWEKIDGQMIRQIAMNSKGAGGWSGVDSDDLRPLFCSKNFGQAADDLCDSLAEMTKRLCRCYVDPEALSSFLACRLVPLEKGENDVRPIGIGETLRRMVGKAAVKAIRSDIRASCGSLQVCAGMEGGCEAAIHAVRSMFEEEETEAALLIDASNAFNSVRRETTLKNIAILCPAFYIFLVNTYRRPIRLFISAWKVEILSLEGTTQGDPAAMGMYALSVLPLIKEAAKNNDDARAFTQSWYADDGTGVGKLTKLRVWWTMLSTLGPNYGYHANARKTVLVVKKEHEQQAREIFGTTGIEIVVSGARHLGAAIGSHDFVEDFIKKKIEKWSTELQTLAKFATTEPQAAYSAFVFGLKGKWTFLQRTLPQSAPFFQPL